MFNVIDEYITKTKDNRTGHTLKQIRKALPEVDVFAATMFKSGTEFEEAYASHVLAHVTRFQGYEVRSVSFGNSGVRYGNKNYGSFVGRKYIEDGGKRSPMQS